MKNKKTTLSDFQNLFTDEFFNELMEDSKQYIPENAYMNSTAVHFSMYIKGKQMEAVRCPYCNSVKVLSSSPYQTYHCKDCDNTMPAVEFGKSLTQRYVINSKSKIKPKEFFTKKIGDIFVLWSVVAYVESHPESADIAYEDGGSNDWMIEGLTEHHRLEDVVLFTPSLGFRIKSFNYSSKLMPLSQASLDSVKYSYNFNIPVKMSSDVIELLELCNSKFEEAQLQCRVNPDDTLYDIICNYNGFLISENAKRKKNKSQNFNLKETLGELPVEKILPIMKKRFAKRAPSVVVNENGKNVDCTIGCHCGNTFSQHVVLDITQNGYLNRTTKLEVQCPKCNAKLITSVGRRNVEPFSYSFDYWQKTDDFIALRRGTFIAQIEYPSLSKCSMELREDNVIQFFPKKIEFYTNVKYDDCLTKEYEEEWRKTTEKNMLPPVYAYGGRDRMADRQVINSEKELFDLIDNSFLKYSGLAHAWGLNGFEDFQTEETGYVGYRCYLTQWYKKPYLEMLVKCKLKRILSFIQTNDLSIGTENSPTDVCSLLGITKKMLKVAVEHDFSSQQLDEFKTLLELQPSFGYEEYRQIISGGVTIYAFRNGCIVTDTAPKKMMEYLDSCYNNQCIERGQALTIFVDYYRMAKDVGFNISDSHIKFPSSLKKEHDKAQFAYRVVQDEKKAQAFIENVKKNKKYEYKNKEFTVIVPKTPDEVVREGQKQHHCVANYVSRIESGETCICFLRRNCDIDTPYFTCEILDNKLYQVKGLSNRYPDNAHEPSLVAFLHQWAEAKGLTEEYNYH